MTATTLARTPVGVPVTRSNATAGWRVATRLARREVQRRWGRTLLVMILVAVPVFGMTTITTLERTSHESPARAFHLAFGSANLVGFENAGTPRGGWPAGTKTVTGHAIGEMGLLATSGTARLARATDVDLNNPVTRGSVLLRAGRFPAHAGEALLSPNLARAFHVRVGDVLRLSDPAWTERVVGLGIPAENWSDGLIAVRGDELTSDRLHTSLSDNQAFTLVQLPGHPTHAQLSRYDGYVSALDNGSDNTPRAVNWTLVAGIIALAIAGVVIAGAFAVGARRQLVTLGQLSANGANEGLLRRTLSLQGAWSGVLGTGFGLGAGVITLVLMHNQFNTWIHRDIGPFAWSPRDLIAIAVTGVIAATIAAYFPARSAARVPVLSALAGRRPLGKLPRTIVPIGLALFGFGLVVLALVASASQNAHGGDGLAAAAVFGGLLVLSGACCVSPVVVASLSHLGARLRSAGRVALRSIVRSRARSAAVVMALAAINSGAIAMGTAFATRTVSNGGPAAAFMPNDTVILEHMTDFDGNGVQTFPPVPEAAERTLRTILPDATLTTRRGVGGAQIISSADQNSSDQITPVFPGRKFAGRPGIGGDVATIADPAVLKLVGLAKADVTTLDRDGVLVIGRGNSRSASVSVEVGGKTLPATFNKHRMRATADIDILITPAEAAKLGLTIVTTGEIVKNPKPLTDSQWASLDALQPIIMFGPSGAPTNSAGDYTNVLSSGRNNHEISPNTVKQIILGVVVLIALIVLAMSLALSAAETRDERDVLVALGARPKTMRRVAAWKAALLSFAGAAIAIPTGFIPVAVIYLAALHPGEHARLAFPTSVALELLVAAPIVAALVAGVGSGIAQKVRPTQMSTFATD